LELAAELGGTFVPLDETHHISRVVLNVDQETIKSHLYIDLSTIDEDIQNDLGKRDFTIDSMAIELNDFLEKPESFQLIDPYGGLLDLQSRMIKVINEEVFKADPARLLRGFRLAAEMGFTLTERTEFLTKCEAPELSRVAGERVREEFLRILATSEAGPMVRYMDDLGILTAIIPEIEAARHVEQPVEHYWDVLNHSLETVAAAGYILRQGRSEYVSPHILDEIPWTESLETHFNSLVSSNANHAVLVKLAALLHDIAKPETKIVDKERVRFFGHDEKGANIATTIMERLHFSNREIKLVESMVRHHMRPTQMSQIGMPSRRALYRFFRDTGEAGIDILFLSLADHLAARGPNLDLEQWHWHLEQVKYIIGEYAKDRTLVMPLKLVNGFDVMNEFGLSPGPRLREILESVREAQAAGEILNREQALSYIKNRLL
jgi:poly(A) polymerase